MPRSEEKTASDVSAGSADLAALMPPARAMELVLVIGPRGTRKTSYVSAVAAAAAATGCEVTCRTFSPFADQLDRDLHGIRGVTVDYGGARVGDRSAAEAFKSIGSRRLLVFDRIDLDESVLGSTKGSAWSDLGRALSLESCLGYCPVIAVLDRDEPTGSKPCFDALQFLEGYCDVIVSFGSVGDEGQASVTVLKSRYGECGCAAVDLGAACC
jgi:hypothetical protein